MSPCSLTLGQLYPLFLRQPTKVKFTVTETKPLKSYSGDKLERLGQIRVPVKYESQTAALPLVVAKGNKVPLLGRNWLEHIRLN